MPPKAKKSPAPRKKSKASKRPSQTNLANNRNTERSVMQTLEQEEPTNNANPPPPPPPRAPVQPAKQRDFTRTMMLPPPPQPPPVPVPAPVVPPQQMTPQPVQGSQMPPMASPMAPQIPPMAPRPPIVNQSQASQSPSVAPVEPMRKASRERADDGGSVDMQETSEKRKRNEIITSWMRLVLQNGVEGLRKEYRESVNEAPMDRATVFSDYPTRNRYNNIPCCDTTRVKLADDPYFYIHANLVSSGPNPRRFICTQAPLNGTIEDFWKMVIVSGLEYVVMLCELVEKGKPKSAEYFPVKMGETMKIGKLCTITKESSVDIDKTLTMSTMRISKPGDNAVARTVKHIHWRNWPDHGVPDNFLSPFRLLTVVKSCLKPVVVHCSAGVGRTGTLVLILIILESICLPDFLGVPRLLTKLREERFKSIQTEMQYLYVHRCILEYLVLKKYNYSRDDYAKFAKEYEQVLATCGAEKG